MKRYEKNQTHFRQRRWHGVGKIQFAHIATKDNVMVKRSKYINWLDKRVTLHISSTSVEELCVDKWFSMYAALGPSSFLINISNFEALIQLKLLSTSNI